ncbi:MAG TPA: tetratricopeptide repeat protein, partial [Pyrinomonadaceae bacterium]|nr:tetratricopeptide repeat protein [Pyrinomonadaceae bacterium]
MLFSDKAFGRTHDLTQQSTERSSGTVDDQDVRALEPGKPIKRELAGGQRHTYKIRLAADQFLKAVVEQDGIDVVVQVSGPDGKRILEFDSESRPRGQEPILLVAEAEGEYLLIVQIRQKESPAGSYEIRTEELRAATDTDRSLYDVRKQYEESIKLQRAGKHNEALPLVERALEIRERLLGAE